MNSKLTKLCLLALLAAPANADEFVTPATYQTAEAAEPHEAAVNRIRHIIRSRGNNPAAVAQLVQLTRDLPVTTAAQLFDDVAGDLFAQGEIDLAAEYRQTLLRRFAQTPAADRAVLWLVQFYASGEVAYAHRSPTPGAPIADTEESADEEGFIRPANFEMLTYAKSLAAGAQLQHQRRQADPALVWQQAAAERLSGRSQAAQGLLTKLKHRQAGDLWRVRARTEEWLREGGLAGEDPPPETSRYALLTAEPPYLDGVLEEAFWQAAKQQAMVVDSSSTVQLAYDEEYLYLAVRAEKIAKGDYQSDPRPRLRDAELDGQDRVRVRLDVDRDYGSAFELTVDHRGWTHDACWSDATWNPEWFVASQEFNNRWQIEAAIPWKSLLATPPQAGAAWSVAVERLLPGKPAAAAEFELLLFQ